MDILFTGASSFTGYWFTKKISTKYNVTCAFPSKKSFYKNKKLTRINNLDKSITKKFNISFGDKKFLKLIKQNKFSKCCIHFFKTDNYNDDNKYKLDQVFSDTLKEINEVIKSLKKNGCNEIIYTGSIFEINEGYPINRNSYNAYGLAKYLTYQALSYYGKKYDIKIKKFVISNPFGILEDDKLSRSVLLNCIKKKDITLNNPNLIRDFIDIDTLSDLYLSFITHSKSNYFAPRGKVESIYSFVSNLITEFKLLSITNSKIKNMPVITGLPKKTVNKDRILKYNYNKYLPIYINNFLSEYK